MKTYLRLVIGLFTLVLVACGSSGGASSAPTPILQGLDKTGIWTAAQVVCADSTNSTITSSAAISPGYQYEVTINGNSLQEHISYGSCDVTTQARIVFSNSRLVSITNHLVISPTSGACSTVSASASASITTAGANLQYASGQIFADQNDVYIESGTNASSGYPNFYIPSSYSDGSPGGHCYLEVWKY